MKFNRDTLKVHHHEKIEFLLKCIKLIEQELLEKGATSFWKEDLGALVCRINAQVVSILQEALTEQESK